MTSDAVKLYSPALTEYEVALRMRKRLCRNLHGRRGRCRCVCVCVYVYILIDIDLDQGRSRERERGFIRKQCQYMTINLPRLLSTAVHITEGTRLCRAARMRHRQKSPICAAKQVNLPYKGTRFCLGSSLNVPREGLGAALAGRGCCSWLLCMQNPSQHSSQ